MRQLGKGRKELAMKNWIIPILATVAVAGCNLENKQNIEAHQRWARTRACVICGVGAEHLKVGDLDKATASAAQALELDADCVAGRLLMAKALLEKGRYLRAAEHLHRAETHAPANAEVPYLLGVALEKREQYDEALKHYQKARALDPSNDAYVTASAEALAASGRSLLALELLETRLERTDGTPSMLALAGELAMLVEEPGKAVDYYHRCLDMQSENLSAREGLAKAYFFAGKHAEALGVLKSLAGQTRYAGKACWVYLITGDCHMALNQPRQAQVAYEQAGRIEPGEPAIWVAQAKAALAAGDVARARIAARRALTLKPAGRDAQVVLAYALLAEGKPAEAAGLLKASPAEAAGDPTVLCVLGRCYASMGRKDQAVSCYLRALRSNPEDPLAKRLLARAGLESEAMH